MLIDTHCHLADPAYDPDRVEVLDRAWAAGVGHVVVIGESAAASDHALTLASDDDRLSATAGVHPHDARSWSAESAAWLRERLRHPRVVAVGEMGLDYHYDHSPRDLQRAAFEAQLALAAEAGKPAVIHAREADDDVAAVLRNQPDAVAILHSFSSGLGLLRAGLVLRHYVSFSGMVTFRSWRLDQAILETPLDRAASREAQRARLRPAGSGADRGGAGPADRRGDRAHRRERRARIRPRTLIHPGTAERFTQ